MKETELKRIIEPRKQGVGYKRIAAITGISINTVKSFCNRHRELMLKPDDARCKQCGKPVGQIPHRKAKLFCSDSCRLKWWNTHPESVNKKAFYKFTCEYCGNEFDSYGNRNRKFCSQDCYRKNKSKEAAVNE